MHHIIHILSFGQAGKATIAVSRFHVLVIATPAIRYGYPVKHPLAEQFGMTLLQPLRPAYRSVEEGTKGALPKQIPIGNS